MQGKESNTIGGGQNNAIITLPGATVGTNIGNVIGGGGNNEIARTDQNSYNGILAGFHNRIDDNSFSFIGGGSENTTIGGASVIGGGTNNSVHGDTNTIGGGDHNNIGNATPGTPGSEWSFIGGGSSNVIDSAVGVRTSFHTIGGGEANYIGPAIRHAGIFSGSLNIVTGNCSAILGGDNNNDGGFARTGMYGTGLVGAAIPGGLGAFFVNELVIQNIPVDPTGLVVYPALPLGALYTTAPAGPWGTRPLFIK